MDMARKHGPMVQNMKDNTMKGRSMEKEHTSGSMDLRTQEDGRTINCVALERISGQMAESTKENFETITCTDEESIPGQMVDVMRETIKMIRSMETANTPGQTVANTKGNGKMENNMAKASIGMLMAIAEPESGSKEREPNGSTTNERSFKHS